MSATTQAIKDMADLRALVAESVELHRQGGRWFGRCPFHEEKTASLSVDERKQLWRCWGAGCGKGGDVFSWVMEHERCDFGEALRYLAQRYGVSLPEWTPEQRQVVELERQVERLLGAVAARARLAYPDSPGAAYLRGRGLADEVAAAWGVGWAESPALLNGLAQEYPPPVWSAAGAAPKSGGQVAAATPGMFEQRIIVPLVRGGRTVNLYGRSIRAPDAYPDEAACNADKHRYLSGRPRLPFGLDEAGANTVLVEGPIDAMSVVATGRPAVAMGGGASEDHRDTILRHTDGPLYIAMDADEQATKGPLMALRLAAMLARGPNGRLVRMVQWGPEGKDASAVLQAGGPEAVQACLAAAVPPVLYRQAHDLELQHAQSLLVQDGSTLQMEGNAGRLWVVESVDNRSDPKGVRAGLRLSQGRSTLNVDNISLMSSIARRRFVNMATKNAQRLDSHTDGLLFSGALEDELLLLEQEVRYWDTELQEREQERERAEDTEAPMTEAERAEALALLQNPYMLEEVVNDTHALGVVGEEDGILVTWLTMTSRLMAEPIYLCFKGESSVGKSFLLKKVSDLCPPEDVRAFTRVTAQALFWAEDPANFLRHKFLIVSEKPGGEGADYSIRTMLSEKGLTMLATEKVDDRMVSKERIIAGPMAYAETTTYLEIHAENETRMLDVHLDSTTDQTQNIHVRQRWEYTLAGRIHEADRQAIVRKHHNAQRLLRPLEVVVPYAELLYFPGMKPRTRRDQPKFLNIICIVAFAHQYRKEVKTLQRGTNAVEYVEADLEDYAVTYELARTLFAVSLDELDKRSRELFEIILEVVEGKWLAAHRDQHAQTLDGTDAQAGGPTAQDLMEVSFTRREIAALSQWSGHAVRATLENLVENELVRTPNSRPGQTYHYYVQFIPTGNVGKELEQTLVAPAELARRLAEREQGGAADGAAE